MSTAATQLLSGAVYNAPLPALVLDARHRVIDYNIALEALFGHEVSGCRDRDVGEFLATVSHRVMGSLLPPQLSLPAQEIPSDRAAGVDAECVFRSGDFGRVRLARTALEWRGVAGGQPAG